MTHILEFIYTDLSRGRIGASTTFEEFIQKYTHISDKFVALTITFTLVSNYHITYSLIVEHDFIQWLDHKNPRVNISQQTTVNWAHFSQIKDPVQDSVKVSSVQSSPLGFLYLEWQNSFPEE
jgi:hypothetical protein